MKYKSFYFAVFFTSFCISQTQVKSFESIKNDSVFKSLKTHKEKDSTRIKLLLKATDKVLYSYPNEAFKLVEEALEISYQIKWISGTISVLQKKGMVYYYTRDYLSTVEVYQKALILSQQTKSNPLLEATIHADIANVYAEMGQYKNALNNYNALLSISKKLKNKRTQIIALSNIGILYTDMGLENKQELIDKGIKTLEEALTLAEEVNNTLFIASIKANLGLAYKRKKKYNIAIKYYLEAYKLAKQIDNKYIEATVLNNIAFINIILKEYDEAEINSNKSLIISKNINDIQRESDSWENLYKIYEFKKNNSKALNAYKNFIKLRDSVLNIDNTEALVRKEMQYEMEKQNTLSTAELEKQKLIKNNYIIGSSCLILLGFIGFIVYKRKQETKESAFKIKVSDTELKALKAQMNPHFIFNSLNSIRDYISKNNIDEADDYLTKFSIFMRRTLESSEKQEIILKDDLELLKTYLEIEQKRLPNRFSYQINIDKDIDIENTLVPPLILQPFIENSIWHGISKLQEKGHIIIEVKKDGNVLICSVEDNGIGKEKSKQNSIKKEKSLGMKITQNRVEIINQLKKTNGSIAVIDKDKGFKVEVKLPLELAF